MPPPQLDEAFENSIAKGVFWNYIIMVNQFFLMFVAFLTIGLVSRLMLPQTISRRSYNYRFVRSNLT